MTLNTSGNINARLELEVIGQKVFYPKISNDFQLHYGIYIYVL